MDDLGGIDPQVGQVARTIHSPPAYRVGRAALVGRLPEMAVLREELVAAFAAGPRSVALQGEPGVGKSRLLGEAIAVARQIDPETVVLRGNCLDERGVPPYLPWVDAFRAPPGRPRSDAPLRALGRRLAGDPGGRSPTAAALPSEQQRFRLFEEVTQALARIALTRPVVLAFDDLQWSDSASNALLRYVMIHLPPSPLLMLGAARADELTSRHPFLRTIDELGRRRLLRPLPVRPLDRAAAASLIAALLAASADPALADAVYAQCGGNPFCIEEVIAALVGGEDQSPVAAAMASRTGTLPLPRGVAAITLRRLERLGPSGQALLETAALAGRVFSAALVAAAAGLSRDAADDLFAAAARHGLIRAADEEDDASVDYQFPHDRVREPIASAIDPVQRRRLHARIADALEADGGLDDLSRLAALAHHRRRARQFEAAAAAAIRLGDCAMLAHAYREAARAYQTALDLSPDRVRPIGGIARVDVLLRLGDAALAAADPAAIETLCAAEAAAQAAGDERAVARARRRLGAAYARREDFASAVVHLDRGRTLLERLIDAGHAERAGLEIELADVLIELAEIEGISLGRYDAAIASGGLALELADRHGGGRSAHAARARLAQANTLMRSGDLSAGGALLPMALAGALDAGDWTLASAVHGAEANVRYWLADLDASERATRQRTQLATQGGDPWALRHAASWQALLDCSRGRWAATERALDDAERFVSVFESSEPRAFLQQIRGLLLLLRGRPAEASALFEAAMAGFRASGPGTLVWYLGRLAAAHAAAGDMTGAEQVAGDVRAVIADVPLGALPTAPALADLALLAARAGDRDEAARLYPALAPFAGQLHWVLIDRALGMLAATMGDGERAERHFQAALALAERRRLGPELALTLAVSGAALLRAGANGDRAIARERLERALPELRRLDMTMDAERVAALLGDADPDVAGGRAANGLSAREREVLALVVDGLTNREIADRLGISDKTVANHLTHIFTKIGVENRAAAVAVALRQRLA